MVAAGGRIYASDVNTRVATATPITSDSGTTSASTESSALISVTATLVAGRRYRVTLQMNVTASVAGDCYFVRIREDSSTGSQIAQQQIYCDTANSSVGFPAHMAGEYAASGSGSKTFVGTLQRNDGTGVGKLVAASGRPATLIVDLINEA